jgi:hypothetical protein
MAKTTWFSILIVVGALAGAACKDDPGSAGQKEEPKPTLDRSNVVKIEPTVPYGKKLPCSRLLDPAKIQEKLGQEVTISDYSDKEVEPTSICSVRMAGTPPSEKEQAKLYEKNGFRIGVQPGDEICQIKAFCSDPYDPAETRKTCEKKGLAVSTEIGDMTCVEQIQAGADYRYIVSVLDPDTKCRYVISPTTIVEQAPMMACARAAVDTIGLENVKVQ